MAYAPEALRKWLPDQRWFQGKARAIDEVRVVDAIALGEWVQDLIVEVGYADGQAERYQVPFAGNPHDGGSDWRDALDVPEACRLLARRCAPESMDLPAPRRLTAEQSNSSVVFGQDAILKVFRLLEPGMNPDVEVTRALTAAGFAHVPAQLGAFVRDGTALAVLSRFVPGRDGFEAATAEAGGNGPTPVLDAIAALGAVVAELHEALREAFGAGRATAGETAARAQAVRARAEDTLRLAGTRAPADAEALLTRLDAFGDLDLGPLVRIHGDLHLGQTLISGARWVLLDFEGEPARPLAERRARSSPLRDVAGMLRSFDYVAGAAPLDAAQRWRDQARERFLDAYLTRAEKSGLLPPDPMRVVAAYELDKAVYELGYELRFRPGWVDIPLAGIARLVSGRREPMRSEMTEVQALQSGAHTDPHRLLGAHPAPPGAVVRTYRPEAERVEVVVAGRAIAAEQTAPGFFEARLDAMPKASEYRLRITYPSGAAFDLYDAYAFWPTVGEVDLHLAGEGRHEELWRRLGAHVTDVDGVSGTAFAVWAPNARAVRVVGDFNSWDGRLHPMRLLGGSGIWELFVPEVGSGTLYKYEIIGADGQLSLRADPYAFATQVPPGTASMVFESAHAWADAAWFARRRNTELVSSPMSVYEVHLGSWRHGDGRPLGYRELARALADHVTALGFTHVEFLPVAEHPFGGSWGYQVTGYFAPTARYGTPDDFRFLVDHLHQRGIGVIVDWVPAHFPRDSWALARFDGTALYEHADPRQGEHPDWGTLVFNFGRNEVRNFLIANALYWLEELHVDGLRVDAVASMLYLDYSRAEGEWVPNPYGGRENLDAVAFLKELNAVVYGRNPGVVTIAEESTAWPAVSRPTHIGGLGFGFKWNMGWMHDTLEYFAHDPVHRRFHHNQLTFAFMYAWSENFILPLSHDEVVHGKRSLLDKMPGDRWQRFANLRALYGWMWAHPGKQLLFMGGEFGQWREWNDNQSLDWHLLSEPDHAGLMRLVGDLNHVSRAHPSLWQRDDDPGGFQWIDANNADDNLLAFVRYGAGLSAPAIACIANLAPVPRHGVRFGLPQPGVWREVLNTDAEGYGGGGVGNLGQVTAGNIAWHGLPASAEITVPPLATLWLAGPGGS